MRRADFIYRAVRAWKDSDRSATWKLEHPDYWRAVEAVERLKAEAQHGG